MHDRGEVGQRGEALVASRLREEGYELLAQNARVGKLELDVVARRGRLFVFCEVRSRSSAAFVDPIATIDFRKVQRVRRAAIAWLRQHGLRADEIRFDAASVLLEPGRAPIVTYFERAF